MTTTTTMATMRPLTTSVAIGSDGDKFPFPVDCDEGVISGVEWSQWHLFINVYLTCLVCLLGFIGNSLTVLVICRSVVSLSVSPRHDFIAEIPTSDREVLSENFSCTFFCDHLTFQNFQFRFLILLSLDLSENRDTCRRNVMISVHFH